VGQRSSEWAVSTNDRENGDDSIHDGTDDDNAEDCVRNDTVDRK
jgi:hypothetical protein